MTLVSYGLTSQYRHWSVTQQNLQTLLHSADVSETTTPVQFCSTYLTDNTATMTADTAMCAILGILYQLCMFYRKNEC